MTRQEKTNWRWVRELSFAWSDCDCRGACPKCIDRLTEIQDISKGMVESFDGPDDGEFFANERR